MSLLEEAKQSYADALKSCSEHDKNLCIKMVKEASLRGRKECQISGFKDAKAALRWLTLEGLSAEILEASTLNLPTYRNEPPTIKVWGWQQIKKKE